MQILVVGASLEHEVVDCLCNQDPGLHLFNLWIPARQGSLLVLLHCIADETVWQSV